jgi:hypothetical protein
VPEKDWDFVSREVVSLFSAITKHTPCYIICLDKFLVCHEFEDDEGWTKWSNDGYGLKLIMEESSAKFLVFSDSGLHELVYRPDKKPELKHILEHQELKKFNIIKSRHDKLELQVVREKDFIIGKMNFTDSYKLKFNSEEWDYLKLRRKILVGKKLTGKLVKAKKPAKKPTITKKTKTNQIQSMVATSHQALEYIRSKFEVPIKKLPEVITDDYGESIQNAEEDIKSLKKPQNRKLAENALSQMRVAVKVIKRCDTDVANRNTRIKKLKRERIDLRKKPMRKLVKKTRMDELARKIKMIDRLNAKELKIKTQRVTEFCDLREAILTIRTNEEVLKPQDISELIDDAILSGAPSVTAKSSKGTKSKGKLPEVQLRGLVYLVESGNKDQWKKYIKNNLKNYEKMSFPPLEPDKCKFEDYGYRQLIELIIESSNFLRIITEKKDVSGFDIVELNNLFRGDPSTLRGIETLCSLLINKETRYNPVSETDFKYLNILLDSFAVSKEIGGKLVWEIETENSKLRVTAAFDKKSREWIYKVD